MLQKFQTSFYKLFILLFVFAIPTAAQANLLVTPLQIVFKDREKNTEITLVNTSKDTNTYKIMWEQLEQVEGAGGYIPVTDEARKTRTDLEDFAVFTPRQITLKPNEKQIVRIAIRKPKDLPDGEYKSHIRFAIVPNLNLTPDTDKKPSKDEIGIGAKVLTSYSVPVVYRSGVYDTKVEIGAPTLSKSPKTSDILINTNVKRSGLSGVIGLITVYYKPNDGKEIQLGSLGNASIYSEITSRDFTIPTGIKSISPGQLRITFTKAEGSEKDFVIMDEKIFPIGQ